MNEHLDKFVKQHAQPLRLLAGALALAGYFVHGALSEQQSKESIKKQLDEMVEDGTIADTVLEHHSPSPLIRPTT